MMKKLLQSSGLVLGLAAACFLAAEVSGRFTSPDAPVPPLWPIAGLGLAALVLFGRQVWPGVALGAFLACVTSPQLSGIKPTPAVAASFAMALGGTLAVLLGAELARRFARGQAAFERPSTVIRFIGLAAMLSTTLGPSLGLAGLWLAGVITWPALLSLWPAHWLGDVASCLVLAPLVIVWSTKRLPRLDTRRVVELIGLVILLALVCQMLFGDWLSGRVQGSLVVLVGPMLLWPALRFGQRGTTAAVFVLACCATLGSLQGLGPLAMVSRNTALVLLQEFLAVVAALALVLAANETQRQRTDSFLARSERRSRELADLGRRLSAAHSPREAAQIIVETADRLFGWDACTFDLYSPGEGTLETVFYADLIDGKRREISAHHTDTRPGPIGEQMLREGAKLILRPAPAAFSRDSLPYGDKARPSASLMYVPLRKENITVGILSIQSYTPKAYSEEDLRDLQALGDHCGGALERIRAEQERIRLNAELQQRVRERTAQLEALNRKLEQHSGQLESLNKELESFSYTVSHDLRAPLRSIRGFSEAVLERYASKLDARGQDFLRRASEAGQRMETLIEDLLKMSRLGRSELRPRQVDLSALAAAIADELSKSEPKRNAEFVIAPGLKAHGDEHLLRVVLDNLLRNAWKFTGKQRHPRIEFGATAPPQRAFFVRDNGAGFDMQYSHQLFGVFHRLHTTSEFPGHGVGLATVQRIINRHGGRVWADGVVNQGATFYFALPTNGSG